ncbi:MAG: hypothetical protein H7843_09170 [Nitrospirota bacterium]
MGKLADTIRSSDRNTNDIDLRSVKRVLEYIIKSLDTIANRVDELEKRIPK